MRCAQAIAAQLPVAPALFAAGDLTDRGLEFRIAEMIREKTDSRAQSGGALRCRGRGGADSPSRTGSSIVDAAIWVDREGQKPIVIGARGERLKRVGRAARLELNGLLGRRLHLELWVKVREDWADNARALQATRASNDAAAPGASSLRPPTSCITGLIATRAAFSRC